MNNQNNTTITNIAANLRALRKQAQVSQEELAAQIGVSRQAVAKWERGESLPDILNCNALADFFAVSLNDLVNHDAEQTQLPIAPRDKHILGTVTISERGQISLPKKARELFGLNAGDTLVVLGDTAPATAGIALVDSKKFLQQMNMIMDEYLKGEWAL